MAVLHVKGGPAEDKQAEDSCSTLLLKACGLGLAAAALVKPACSTGPKCCSNFTGWSPPHARNTVARSCHPDADGHLTGGLAISMAMSTAASNAISIARAYAIAMANSTASSNSGPSTIPHYDTTSMPGEETLPAVTCRSPHPLRHITRPAAACRLDENFYSCLQILNRTAF